MAVTFIIRCDDCGAEVGRSSASVRAARADAALNHGANHSPAGDRCRACRIAATTLTADDHARASERRHSASAGPPADR
jgi:hypothetical protein